MDDIPRNIEAGIDFVTHLLSGRRVDQADALELHLHKDQSLSLDYHPRMGTGIESSGGWLRATVRVWKGGRCGLAGGPVSTHADVRRLAVEASRSARFGQPVPFPGGLVGTMPAAKPEGELSREHLWQRAHALIETFRPLDVNFQALLLKQFDSWSVIANTEGLLTAYYQPTEQHLVSCETPRGTIVDAVAAQRLGGEWRTQLLYARIAAAVEVLRIEGGQPDLNLPCVLRPAVAAPLVAGLAWLLRGDTVLKQPALLHAVGKKLFPSVLNVYDDPVHPAGMNKRTVDDEGRRAVPVCLIEGGRITSFVHSTESAYRLQAQPNGRAVRFTAAEPAIPWPLNLHIVPGHAPLPDSYNELVARIDTQKTIPPSSLVSLLVAGWEVRNQKRTRPIGPLNLHLPLIPTFRRLRGVGSDLTFLPTADGCGSPTLIFEPLLEQWRE